MVEFTSDENVLIDNCLKLILQLIHNVGDIVKEGYELTSKKIEYKDANSVDVVTEYDKRIERFLIDGIKQQYPDHKYVCGAIEKPLILKPLQNINILKSFLAEETIKDNVLTDSPTWIIDPIDGTKSYIQYLPYFAVSVAMTIKKELVLGIVYNPILNELYSARLGNGSFLNGNLIKCSNVENLDESLHCNEISFLNGEQFREKTIKRIYKLTSICPGSRCFGNTALTLAYVARGSVDCFQIEYIKPWDVAAGVLLIQEAGGKVYNTNGEKFSVMEPHLACAGTEKLCQQLLVSISEADKSKLLFQ